VILKTCSKCKEQKPHSEFHKNKTRKDGLQSHCKKCQSRCAKQYYKENKEKIKQYRKENPENKRQQQKRYYKKNAERLKKYYKQYREENIEKERQRNKQYLKNLPAAVYKIENTETGQVYIGQSTQYKSRWYSHRYQLRRNKHNNHKLQEDYDKYGLDVFEFKIIKEFPPDTTSDVLLKEEKKMITEYNHRGENLYNIQESEE
tara:strand:- start:33 stop:641 length:609 start_codon:yes stop_codon:yes gene_type:complete